MPTTLCPLPPLSLQAIDAPLKRLLETGAIRILDCSWLLREEKKLKLPRVTKVQASVLLLGERRTPFDLPTKQLLVHKIADRIGVSCISVVVDAFQEGHDELMTNAQLALFRNLFRPTLANADGAADDRRGPRRQDLGRVRSKVRQLQELLDQELAPDSLEHLALKAFAERTAWFWTKSANADVIELANKSLPKKKPRSSAVNASVPKAGTAQGIKQSLQQHSPQSFAQSFAHRDAQRAHRDAQLKQAATVVQAVQRMRIACALCA